MNKRGGETILVEQIIFVVLNLIFFISLFFFVNRSVGNAAILEQYYAKEIALSLDNAKPDMTLSLYFEDAYNLAKKNNFPVENSIKVEDNKVTVKLRENGGYSYTFFSDIKVETINVRKEGVFFTIRKNE